MSSSRHPSQTGSGFEPTEVHQTPPVEHDAEPTAIVAPAPPVDVDLTPGTMVGEYRIERRIGRGGMGVVFAAIHPVIGKRAAIKILRAELCRDRITVERFINEARVVNQIGHPNIVDVFAFGQLPDGRQYFVMEWLKGESMRARIARSRLTLAEVCSFVRPLGRALVAAHAQGVVHRDLKPDNIFLVDEGDELPAVKLLDFGIAKLAHADHRMEQTASGALVGTPQYMPPEQAKGQPVDHRADVYALGAVAFEMITKRLPFVGGSAMEVIALHLMEPPPRPSTLVHGLPPELDELIVRMLAKDPNARPALATVVETFERARLWKAELVPIDATVSVAIEAVGTPYPKLLSAPITTVDAAAREPARSKRWLLIGPILALVAGAAAFAIVNATSSKDSTPVEPRPESKAPAVPAPPPPPPMSAQPAPTPAVPPTPTPPTTTPATSPAVLPTPTPPIHKPTTPPHPHAANPPKPPKPPKPSPPAAGSADDLLFEPGTLEQK